MKLDIYYAKENIPQPLEIKYPNTAVRAEEALGAQIGQLGQNLAIQTAQMGKIYAEQRSREQQLDLVNESALASAAYEEGLHQIKIANRETPFDKKELVEKFTTMAVDQLNDDMRGKFSNAALAHASPRIAVAHTQFMKDETDHMHQRWIVATGEKLNTIVQSNMQRVVENPDNSLIVRDAQFQILASMRARNEVIPFANLQAEEDKVMKEMQIAQAAALYQKDPEFAKKELLNPGSFVYIPFEERQKMAREYDNQEYIAWSRAITQEEHRDKMIERSVKDGQDMAHTVLTDQAYDGVDIQQTAQDWAIERKITSEQRDHAIEIQHKVAEIKAKGEEGIDNPSVAYPMQMDSVSIHPETRPWEVDAAFNNGDLTLKTAMAIKSRISNTLDSQRKEGESEWSAAHSKAEEIFKTGLGITGIPAPDENRDRLASMGLYELSKRSKAFQKMWGGSEDPLKVVQEMLPRYQQMLGMEVSLTAKELSSGLRFDSASELYDAYKSGQITQQEYSIQSGLMQQFRKTWDKAHPDDLLMPDSSIREKTSGVVQQAPTTPKSPAKPAAPKPSPAPAPKVEEKPKEKSILDGPMPKWKKGSLVPTPLPENR